MRLDLILLNTYDPLLCFSQCTDTVRTNLAALTHPSLNAVLRFIVLGLIPPHRWCPSSASASVLLVRLASSLVRNQFGMSLVRFVFDSGFFHTFVVVTEVDREAAQNCPLTERGADAATASAASNFTFYCYSCCCCCCSCSLCCCCCLRIFLRF